MPSLRDRINQNCINCTYDPSAAGTWRQQTTLCPVTDCALYDVRPTTKHDIPQSVLNYYRVTDSEYAQIIERIHGGCTDV